MTRFFRIVILAAALAVTALMFAGVFTPANAHAATIGNDYGPWFPAPGAFGKEDPSLYQTDIQVYGSPAVSDIADFTCVYPTGSPGGVAGAPISSTDQAILGEIFADATAAYNGTLTTGDNTQEPTKSNYAITGGEAGMIAFLTDTKTALAQGGWVQFSTHSTAAPGQSQGTGEVLPAMLYQQYEQSLKQIGNNNSQVANAQGDLPTREAALAKYGVEARSLIAKIKALSTQYPDLGNFQLQDVSTGEVLSYSQADADALHLPAVVVTGANHKSAGYSVLESDLSVVPASLGWNNISKYEAKVSAAISADQQTIANGISSYTKAQLSSGLGAPPLPALAALIDTNPAQANVPLNLAYLVPQGCGLNPIDAQGVDFIQIITAPGTFFTDLLLYIPEHAAQASYNFLQPKAFLYTFWTPHTERGDTIFNISTSCGTTYAQQAASNQTDCTAGVPLGFNKKNTQAYNLKQNMPWYLSIAIFFQWFISGFYFIILFTAAVLYMIRGNARTQLNVLTLVPKLILSALLTIFAPTIIGALIDFSNVFVSSIFSLDSARSVGRLTDILAQSNTYVGAAGDLVSQLIQVLVGLFTDFFFAFFILGSLIRQVVLMLLVVTAPLACFCIMVPRWKQHFSRYVRTLLVVVFLPAVMAFILKLGIAVNPIVTGAANGQNVTGVSGLIGLLLVMVTLWVMAKAMKIGASVATGNAAYQNSLTGRAMGGLGRMATAAATAGTGGLAMGFAGRALGAASAASAAGDAAGAKLIPMGKSLVGGGGSGTVAVGSGARRLGLPPAGGSGFGAGVSKTVESQRRGLAQRYDQFLENKTKGHGEERITQGRANAYKRDLGAAVAAKEDEAGKRMSKGQRDEFMHGSFVRDEAGKVILENGRKVRRADGYEATHGALVERRGHAFIATAGTERPPSRAAAIAHGVNVGGGALVAAPVVAAATTARAMARGADQRVTGGRVGAATGAAIGGVRDAAGGVRDIGAVVAAGGPRRARVGSVESDSAESVYAAAATIASDPNLLQAQRQAGADYMQAHPLCPRCGAPTTDGKCLNPACSPVPTPTPSRRRHVSEPVVETAPETAAAATELAPGTSTAPGTSSVRLLR